MLEFILFAMSVTSLVVASYLGLRGYVWDMVAGLVLSVAFGCSFVVMVLQ